MRRRTDPKLFFLPFLGFFLSCGLPNNVDIPLPLLSVSLPLANINKAVFSVPNISNFRSLVLYYKFYTDGDATIQSDRSFLDNLADNQMSGGAGSLKARGFRPVHKIPEKQPTGTLPEEAPLLGAGDVQAGDTLTLTRDPVTSAFSLEVRGKTFTLSRDVIYPKGLDYRQYKPFGGPNAYGRSPRDADIPPRSVLLKVSFAGYLVSLDPGTLTSLRSLPAFLGTFIMQIQP